MSILLEMLEKMRGKKGGASREGVCYAFFPRLLRRRDVTLLCQFSLSIVEFQFGWDVFLFIRS